MTGDGRLGLAIAGFGWWGEHMSRRLAGNGKIAVAGIIEPAQDRAAMVRERGLTHFDTLADALADPAVQAVALTTPNELHEAQTVEVAGAGRHVFCEKPLALSAASARRSVAACERAGGVLGIGHERRFEPALAEVRAMVAAGTLGTVMHAEAAFSHDKLIDVPPGDWRTRKATAPAAAMTGMGVHLTDYYIALFGRVKTVQALTARRVLEWETGDVVTAQLGFAAGMTASLSAILYTPHFIRLHVFGSSAWVEVRNATHPDTPGGITDMTLYTTAGGAELHRFEWHDTVVQNLEAFADAIAGRAPYPYTRDELIHNIEVLEAIARSAETGETVHLG